MKAKTSNELIAILKSRCCERQIYPDVIPAESTQNTIYRYWETIYEYDNEKLNELVRGLEADRNRAVAQQTDIIVQKDKRIRELEELLQSYKKQQLVKKTVVVAQEKPPIVELLIRLFTEKGLWSSTDLKNEVKKAGLSRNLLFTTPEVQDLPIYKFRADDDDAKDEGLEEGEMYWRAQKGWPS